MKPKVGKVILGGFIGTLAITLMMYKLAPMMGLMKMDIATMLGSMLGGWAMGMMMHFVNGTVIFPLIYAYLLFRLLPGPPPAKGVLWGVILWGVAQLMVMPMMGQGFFSMKAGSLMPAMASLMGHIIYGLLLGWVGGTAGQPEIRLRAKAA